MISVNANLSFVLPFGNNSIFLLYSTTMINLSLHVHRLTVFGNMEPAELIGTHYFVMNVSGGSIDVWVI